MRVFSALPTLSSLAAIAAMGLAACMSTQETSEPGSDSRKLSEHEYEAAAGLFKKTASVADPSLEEFNGNFTSYMQQAKQQMRAAGVCEGMIGVVDDLIRFYDASTDTGFFNEFDPSFSAYPSIARMVQCLGISVSGEAEDLATGLADINALSNCICGGNGSIFGDYDAIARAEWSGFSPAAVTESGFSPASASSSGFRPSSTSGFQPSGTSGGFTPSSP